MHSMFESLPAPVLESMTDLDKCVLKLVMDWMGSDPSHSLEMQGKTLGETVRPSICRNLADNSWFIKIEQREWSSYSKTNWWKGRAYRNSYEHPLKVVAEMILEHWTNAMDPEATTEYEGGV